MSIRFNNTNLWRRKIFYFSIKTNEWIGIEEIYEYPFRLKKCVRYDFFNLVNWYEWSWWNIISIFKWISYFTLDGLYTDYYEVRLTEYGMNNLEEYRSFMQNNPIEMDIYF